MYCKDLGLEPIETNDCNNIQKALISENFDGEVANWVKNAAQTHTTNFYVFSMLGQETALHPEGSGSCAWRMQEKRLLAQGWTYKRSNKFQALCKQK